MKSASKPHVRSIAVALLSLCSLVWAAAASAQANRPALGLDLQHARAKFIIVKAKKIFYTKRWDLSGLPAYHPTAQVSGTLRLWGSNYIQDGNLGQYWATAFQKFQPGVRFVFHMQTTLAAVPALVFGVADIGVGRKITFAEQLLYERYENRDPLEVSAATGSYDVTGWQPAYGIVVSKDNPLVHLTMQQLDGIFGAERLGGWVGTSWHPEFARGSAANIRTWGQLGLAGDWAKRPIDVYGLNLRYHQATEMSDLILKGSDKWNERLRIYANYVTKDGKLGRSLKSDLAQDRYGIAWIAAPTYKLPPGLKVLPIAARPGGTYVPYTMDTVRDRSYPLFSQIFMYVNRRADGSIDPTVKQFLRFIVSREGQEAIERDGKYLPLTAKVAHEEMDKLK